MHTVTCWDSNNGSMVNSKSFLVDRLYGDRHLYLFNLKYMPAYMYLFLTRMGYPCLSLAAFARAKERYFIRFNWYYASSREKWTNGTGKSHEL